MSYFYADGVDKQGNRLLTSYGKQDQAKRYRPGATVTQGEKFLDIQEDGSAKMSTEGELLLRTLMVRDSNEADEMTGRFVVYARINGRWQETQFRYPTYAKANAAVKSALINLYPACAVVEEDQSPVSDEVEAPAVLNEEAIF
jgi:hypothetical protein